jgi:formylglycine-generating enzyme required for sulfatase activity/pimeloyl-ACP methyl ester carboxylesterase
MGGDGTRLRGFGGAALPGAGDGSDLWLTRLAEDLADEALSPEMMTGFPHAHGGIVSVSMDAEQNRFSALPGDEIEATISMDAGGDGGGFSYEVAGGPDGLEVDADGRVTYALPADETEGRDIPFAIRVVNGETGFGREIAGVISVMAFGEVDNDGDGYTEEQGDCDDGNPAAYPGAAEICDDGVDQDCDGADAICAELDRDGDGFTGAQGDCDDGNAAAYPGAEEICGDGVDQDCDGADAICAEDLDADEDGFSEAEGDCDDEDPARNPGAEDVCGDGVDQDCDGEDAVCPTVWYKDSDGDGYSDGATQESVNRPEGYAVEEELTAVSGDCDDENADVHPGAADTCNDGIDQDCSGSDAVCGTPSPQPTTSTWYKDMDGDGYSDGATQTTAIRPAGYYTASELVRISGDCDDGEPSIHPGVIDLCGDGIDQNCDGSETDCILTISGKASNDPIAGGNVTITNTDDNIIATGKTDSVGNFSIQVPLDIIQSGYIIKVNGGQIKGEAFADELKAIYSTSDNATAANVTLITTLIFKLAETLEGTTWLENRDAAIEELVEIGMLNDGQWMQLEPDFVDMEGLRIIVRRLGLEEWITQIVDDLQDNDLSPNSMEGFPNAHGGIAEVSFGINGTLSVFLKDEVRSKLKLTAPEDVNYSYELIAGPEGMSIDINGNIAYSMPEDAQPGVSLNFEVKVINPNNNRGRSFKGSVYPMNKEVIASETIGPEGGVLNDVWNEVKVNIPQGAVTEDTAIAITRNRDSEGNILITLEADQETGYVTVELPDPEASELNDNYNNAQPDRRSRSVDTYPLQYFREELDSEPNWFAQYAYFCELRARGVPTNPFGLGNRISGKNIVVSLSPLRKYVIEQYFGSRLSSECSYLDYSCYQNKIPVLFVHGFSPNTPLVSDKGLGGGEGTWQNFPAMIKQVDSERIIVFEFRWNTASRFQDAASDLGKAISQISEKTGKKVHIIAHSFGGVLTRTYLQGFGTDFPYRDNVASVTTIGSPHSGIPDSEKFMHDEFFPAGQDSQWFNNSGIPGNVQINLTRQISVYQMGEFVDFSQDELFAYKLDIPDDWYADFEAQAFPEYYGMDVPDNMPLSSKPGKFIAVLSDMSKYPLPPGLPIQVLIGLTTYRGEKKTDDLDEGDGLITFEGQRFSPILGFLDELLLNQSTYYGGLITEQIMSFEGSARPGDRNPHADVQSDQFNYDKIMGYRHSGSPVGPTFTPEMANVECTDADSCQHDAYILAKNWIVANETDEIQQFGTFTLNMDIHDASTNAPISDRSVYVKVNVNGEFYETATAVDGSVNYFDVPFYPDSTYYLIVNAEGYRVPTDLPELKTMNTIELSDSDFGTIEIEPIGGDISGTIDYYINYVSSGYPLGATEYQIVDTGGAVVHQSRSNEECAFYVRNLPEGKYYLELMNSNFYFKDISCIESSGGDCETNRIEVNVQDHSTADIAAYVCRYPITDENGTVISNPGNAVLCGRPYLHLGPPDIPTNVTAAPGNGRVTITWDPVDGATSYYIVGGASSGGAISITGITTSSYTMEDVENGVTYYMSVVAVNSEGESDPSTQVSATPTETTVGETVTDSSGLDMTFVRIPAAGQMFYMGSPDTDPDALDREFPRHPVTFSQDFYIMTTEVTNDQFVAFLNDVGQRGPTGEPWFETQSEDSYSKILGDVGNFYVEAGYENHPVVNVSWYGAKALADWLTAREGKTYRLPTESEWEYAARAGTQTPFAFADCLGTDQANYRGTSPLTGCPAGEYRAGTVEVGTLGKNGWDLHDMHGNVYEWVEDQYHSSYDGAPTDGSAWVDLSEGSDRVLRGGSWSYNARSCRSADRSIGAPSVRNSNRGFRLALSPGQ